MKRPGCITWSHASKVSSRGLSRGASEPAFGWAPRHTLVKVIKVVVVVVMVVVVVVVVVV